MNVIVHSRVSIIIGVPTTYMYLYHSIIIQLVVVVSEKITVSCVIDVVLISSSVI